MWRKIVAIFVVLLAVQFLSLVGYRLALALAGHSLEGLRAYDGSWAYGGSGTIRAETAHWGKMGGYLIDFSICAIPLGIVAGMTMLIRGSRENSKRLRLWGWGVIVVAAASVMICLQTFIPLPWQGPEVIGRFKECETEKQPVSATTNEPKM